MAGCTSLKQVNRKKSKNKSSKFFGVYWHKPKRKWRAVMRKNKKQVFLGYFREEEEAAKKYIEEASIFYKQPVRQNGEFYERRDN